LTGAGAARLARVRKAGGDRADVGIRVPVVEVINGNAAIHQDGLFDQSLPEHLGEEIDVLLRAAGAQRDVVHALQETRHGSSTRTNKMTSSAFQKLRSRRSHRDSRLQLRTDHLSTLDQDRKSTRLNSSHRTISYAVFC